MMEHIYRILCPNCRGEVVLKEAQLAGSGLVVCRTCGKLVDARAIVIARKKQEKAILKKDQAISQNQKGSRNYTEPYNSPRVSRNTASPNSTTQEFSRIQKTISKFEGDNLERARKWFKRH